MTFERGAIMRGLSGPVHVATFLVSAFLVAIAGCNTSSDVALTGQVTLDGRPVELGEIRFMPADGKGQPAGGAIRNGTYQVKVPRGSMKVLITAFEEGEEQALYEDVPNSPTAPLMKQIAEQHLTFEVTAPGTKDFALKVK